jgi:hypothetical protein
MSLFQIPVTNNPETFQISLAGTTYTLTVKFNSALEGGWVLDIADAENVQKIVCNAPLITGANLLDGLGYLGINGSLFVRTEGNNFAVPTYENLGIESFLYFEVLENV